MKRVFLIHGWEGYPEEGWFPWLKQELEAGGFNVIVPTMPDTANPTYGKWIHFLARVVSKVSKDDYFVGHSLGCITILRFLETLKAQEKIGGIVLVAGFGHDLEYPDYRQELASFFQKPVDWEKIKSHCSKFVAIHSDDDPYVPLLHSRLFQEKLGAKSIIEHNMKHFSADDNIIELPSTLDAVRKISGSRGGE